MTPNCRICVDLVIDHEVGPFMSTGGFQKNPADPGNWTGGKPSVGILKGTKWGIAASAHPDLDIERLTLEQAEAIYETEYWTRMQGDSLPLPLAMATLDAEVMSGLGGARNERAAGWLQEAVGVAPDGDIGPHTIIAAATCDQAVAVKQACALRLNFLTKLTTWSKFGGGWRARVEDTEQKAIAAIGSMK